MSNRTPGFNLLVSVILVSAVMVLQGCASSNDLQKALNPDPPGVMYAAADKLMTRGKYEAAAKKFEDLDRDHPYSPEARRAIV
ncbi:MAG TPA: outer membrane protein assembly factor BamD, partial [Hyphomicrobiaceae bacterium]|nr:outer membrane protein assembly factor BamD [Hyphomicrobiaceae bacterium]